MRVSIQQEEARVMVLPSGHPGLGICEVLGSQWSRIGGRSILREP
jgi:hypothetical protein